MTALRENELPPWHAAKHHGNVRPPARLKVRCSMPCGMSSRVITHPIPPRSPPLLPVLGNPVLVEHALRQSLVADAQTLQFKLPPPGVSAPPARKSVTVAGGADVVDALVVTSVWAVHLLRTLCQVRLIARKTCMCLSCGAMWLASASVTLFEPLCRRQCAAFRNIKRGKS